MKHNFAQKSDGFTLIEVALVLALAGAIFAAVFVALRGVWADERDSERRDDIMTFIRQLKNYQTNNARGSLPTPNTSTELNTPTRVDGVDVAVDRKDQNAAANSWAGFYRDYFNDSFIDPDGDYYNLSISYCNTKNLDSSCNVSVAENYTMYVVISAYCYGEDAVRSANARNVAVLYDMEAGGIYCENT